MNEVLSAPSCNIFLIIIIMLLLLLLLLILLLYPHNAVINQGPMLKLTFHLTFFM